MNLKQGQILTPKSKYRVMKGEYESEYNCYQCCFGANDGCGGHSILLTKTKTAMALCNHVTYFLEVED